MSARSREAVQQAEVNAEKLPDRVLDAGINNTGQNEDQTKHITVYEKASWSDAFLVNFSPDDAENPLNWSTKLKWGITIAISGTGFVRIMVSTARIQT